MLDPTIAADLVRKASLRERISRSRKQPLILHADNGNFTHVIRLESRLSELGVLRPSSHLRVSNEKHHSESLFEMGNTCLITRGSRSIAITRLGIWCLCLLSGSIYRDCHSGIKFETHD